MVGAGELADLARRALRHSANGTTDSAEDVVEIPVSGYLDPTVWQTEIELLFKRHPIPIALSAELSGPGDYKAFEAAGLPLLVTRGTDGVVRTFLNVCRHRGARICAPGTGNTTRFTCPYHAWSYNSQGRLVGVYRADQFGPVDRDGRGLVSLPTEERHGLVFAVLSPTATLDLDAWLGDFARQLEAIGLEKWHFHDQVALPGANWKLVFDGYLEGYHGEVLHAASLGRGSIGNLTLLDGYGRHQRMVFAQKSLETLRDEPESRWDPAPHLVSNHILFPNVSIAGGWQEMGMVCLVLPGATADTSVTYQTVLTREPRVSRLDRAISRKFSGLMLRVARDEDYPTVLALQQVLSSGANTHFLIGRNEPAVQRFHAALAELVGRPTAES